MKKHYEGHIKILVTHNSEAVGIPLSKILQEFEQIQTDSSVKSLEALAEYHKHSTGSAGMMSDAYHSDLGNEELLIAIQEVNRARISIILTNDLEVRRSCIRARAHCFLGKSNRFEHISQLIDRLEEETYK